MVMSLVYITIRYLSTLELETVSHVDSHIYT